MWSDHVATIVSIPGLIHANHGSKVMDYLRKQLETATASNVKHGAAMGLGLAGMATRREDLMRPLLDNLNQDDAITGGFLLSIFFILVFVFCSSCHGSRRFTSFL